MRKWVRMCTASLFLYIATMHKTRKEGDFPKIRDVRVQFLLHF